MMIEWDGTQVPKELKQLPPGRYVLTDAYLEDDDLTPEEEEGIRLALDEVEAGDFVTLDEAMQQVRARASRE
jgi:hypothetical protein